MAIQFGNSIKKEVDLQDEGTSTTSSAPNQTVIQKQLIKVRRDFDGLLTRVTHLHQCIERDEAVINALLCEERRLQEALE